MQNSKAELIQRFISDTINNQNKLLSRSTDGGFRKMPKEYRSARELTKYNYIYFTVFGLAF